MSIAILPATEADIATLVHIELEAFKSHPRIPMLWPRGYTSDLYAFYEHKKATALRNPDTRIIKAVDSETQSVVGASEATYALDHTSIAAQPAPDANELPPADWPRGGNWEMRRYFALNTQKLIQESFVSRGEGYILVEILVVDPDQQGKGVGSRLLEWWIGESQRWNVPLALESTPAGLAMYKRFGFEEQVTVKADMRQFGWTGDYDEDSAKRVWMVRPPVRE